jgi:hypothetical protein
MVAKCNTARHAGGDEWRGKPMEVRVGKINNWAVKCRSSDILDLRMIVPLSPTPADSPIAERRLPSQAVG